MLPLHALYKYIYTKNHVLRDHLIESKPLDYLDLKFRSMFYTTDLGWYSKAALGTTVDILQQTRHLAQTFI